MQRSLLLFNESIKAEATRKNYLGNLDKFLAWSKLKDYDSILRIDDKDLQVMLEDYIFYLKKKHHPNSVPKYLSGIEHFLIINDKELKFKKLHKMFPEQVKESGRDAYTTQQIRDMLSCTTDHRNKFLIYFMTSTGARIGAIPDIKLGDIRDMPMDCKAITLYTDSKEESIAFLTPETSKFLQNYLDKREVDGERLTDLSPLFRTHYTWGGAKAKPMSKKAVEGTTYRIIEKSGIKRTKKGVRHNIQANHGFRKWYRTRISMTVGITAEIGKKLVQHKDLEGKYTTPEPMELFESFKFAIPTLTLSKEEKMKIENKKLADDNSRLEREIQRSKILEEDMEKMQNDMKEMQFKYHEAKNKPLTDEELESLAKKIKKLKQI